MSLTTLPTAATPVGGALDAVTDAITANLPLFIAAAGVAIAAGVGIAIMIWAAPKLMGVFKKTAK
jgi:hypothetical protein